MATKNFSRQAFVYADNEGELGALSMDVPAITAANHATELTKALAVRDALEALTIGMLNDYSWGTRMVISPVEKAASLLAQRQTVWLVRYRDTVTTSIYTVKIPCADLTLKKAGDKSIDTTAPVWVTFKSAAEAYWLSPAGNPIEILDCVHIGRS